MDTVQCPHCSQTFDIIPDGTPPVSQRYYNYGRYTDIISDGMVCRYCDTKTFSYKHIEGCRAMAEAKERISLQDRIEDLKTIYTCLNNPDWDGRMAPKVYIKSAIETLKIGDLSAVKQRTVIDDLRRALECL